MHRTRWHIVKGVGKNGAHWERWDPINTAIYGFTFSLLYFGFFTKKKKEKKLKWKSGAAQFHCIFPHTNLLHAEQSKWLRVTMGVGILSTAAGHYTFRTFVSWLVESNKTDAADQTKCMRWKFCFQRKPFAMGDAVLDCFFFFFPNTSELQRITQFVWGNDDDSNLARTKIHIFFSLFWLFW